MYILLYILLFRYVDSFTLKYNFNVPFMCEIHNLDLTNLKLGDVDELQYLFKSTPVMIFKNQKLTPQQQFDLSSIFDTRYTKETINLNQDLQVPECPQLSIIGKGFVNNTFGIINKNIKNNRNFKYNKIWKQNSVGIKNKLPSIVNSMYILEVPEENNSCLSFASLEKGYENVLHNCKKKLQIKTLQGCYSKKISLNSEIDHTGYSRIDKYWPSDHNIHEMIFLKELDILQKDIVIQPFVIYPQENSVKQSLLINPINLCSFVGYSPKASQELLNEIMNKYVLLDNNIGKLNYSKNDFIVFNNRKILHATSPYQEIEGNLLISFLMLGTQEKLRNGIN